MAEGRQTFIFRGYSISPDNAKAVYFYNETGSYAEFTMKIKNLASGEKIGFTIDGAASMAWANDNHTIFYSQIDKTLRSSKISPSSPIASRRSAGSTRTPRSPQPAT